MEKEQTLITKNAKREREKKGNGRTKKLIITTLYYNKKRTKKIEKSTKKKDSNHKTKMQTIPQCADKCGAAIVVVVEGATARPRRCNAGSRRRR